MRFLPDIFKLCRPSGSAGGNSALIRTFFYYSEFHVKALHMAINT